MIGPKCVARLLLIAGLAIGPVCPMAQMAQAMTMPAKASVDAPMPACCLMHPAEIQPAIRSAVESTVFVGATILPLRFVADAPLRCDGKRLKAAVCRSDPKFETRSPNKRE